jgi:hypothetical protein
MEERVPGVGSPRWKAGKRRRRGSESQGVHSTFFLKSDSTRDRSLHVPPQATQGASAHTGQRLRGGRPIICDGSEAELAKL